MKFAIITHVNHIQKEDLYFGYAPYIFEMNIWLKFIDKLIIVAPLTQNDLTEIDVSYNFKEIDFREVPNFNFTSLKDILSALLKLPKIFWIVFWAIKKADHIHLRCPGNVGLLGCIIQIFFPKKTKTAKYAGNWDPKSKQLWTYKLQKYILSNTFLTKNMQVLVYGEWENQSKNIKPFFTATYFESEKEIIPKKDFNLGINFIFVGSFTVGKNPLYAIKIVEKLIQNGYDVSLDLYGEGSERHFLENYIEINKLQQFIKIRGNQNKYTLKKAYRKSHFVILPSKSEGWPKVIAEGMFWGCVPLATKISCVPFMLDNENRGLLLDINLEKDIQKIEEMLKHKAIYDAKSKHASDWSRKYTLDIFEAEIKTILS